MFPIFPSIKNSNKITPNSKKRLQKSLFEGVFLRLTPKLPSKVKRGSSLYPANLDMVKVQRHRLIKDFIRRKAVMEDGKV